MFNIHARNNPKNQFKLEFFKKVKVLKENGYLYNTSTMLNGLNIQTYLSAFQICDRPSLI